MGWRLRRQLCVWFLAVGLAACGDPRRPLSASSEAVRFPPTDVGTQSEARVVLTNPGASAVSVALDVSPPFGVDEQSLDLAPGASQRLVVRFSPAAAGKAEGSIRFTSEGSVWSLPVEGEGRALDCPASACRIARRDASGRCVEEVAPDGAGCKSACVDRGACMAGLCVGSPRWCDDGDPCTEDSCDPLLGCRARPLSEGASCGVASCEKAPVCRSGACVAEAVTEADRMVCGLDDPTIERPADARREKASLFLRTSGALDVVAPGLLERRAPDGTWTDASTVLGAQPFSVATTAGPDSFWLGDQSRIVKVTLSLPPAPAFETDEVVYTLQDGTEHSVWADDGVSFVEAGGSRYGAYMLDPDFLRQFVVCDDGIWQLSPGSTVQLPSGKVHAWDGERLAAGACVEGKLLGLAAGRLVTWGSEGWVARGPHLPARALDSEGRRRLIRMRAKSADDVWVEDAVLGRFHWNGTRWTRLPWTPLAWQPVSENEAWAIESDGSLVHRRRP